MDDVISRQVVVDTVHKTILGFFSDEDGAMTDTEKTLLSVNKAICDGVRALPSAQPKTHEERTETHACDLISRQAAIDALVGITMFKTKHELIQRVNASVQDEQGWLGAVAECLDEIEDLPSAEPERTGRWIFDENDYLTKCSECGCHPWFGVIPTVKEATKKLPHCPICLAKMEGE